MNQMDVEIDVVMRDLAGPLDRPLTRAEWDLANRVLRDLRDKLEKETDAAARFCKELADVRILLDNVKNERDAALTQAWEHDKLIEHMRATLRQLLDDLPPQ